MQVSLRRSLDSLGGVAGELQLLVDKPHDLPAVQLSDLLDREQFQFLTPATSTNTSRCGSIGSVR